MEVMPGLLGHHEMEPGGVVEVGVGGDVGERLLVGGRPLDSGHVHGVHADGQIRLLLLELDDVGGGVAGQHGDFIVGVGIGERFGDEADAEVPAAGHGAGHGSQPGLFGKGGGGEQCDGQGHGSGYKVCTHGWNLQRLGFAIHSGTVQAAAMGEPPFLRRCANKTIRRLERPMVSVMRPGKMSMSRWRARVHVPRGGSGRGASFASRRLCR